MQHLIVIEGPTASGKTALAIALAKKINTVVLSADSRQFYQEMSIGTAKPLLEEMDGVPHYFIDSHTIEAPLTAATFESEAVQLITGELKERPQLILVGGSGMFIDALCEGLDPIPTDSNLQQELRKELNEKGLEPLLAELQIKDPAFYDQVDRKNPVRILRALEVIRSTNKTFSEWRTKTAPSRPFQVKRFVINLPRDILYERINQRVDKMWKAGLVAEVETLLPYRDCAPLQTVGYKEVFDFLDGTIDEQACIELVKQHTRNYAKRQLTWFRRHPEAVWLQASDTEKQVDEIIQYLHS